jgi:hypothetical protein
MKFIVIGQPRSRSNYFLDSLAQQTGLTNLGEPYSELNTLEQIHSQRDQLGQQDDIVVKIQWNHLALAGELLTPQDLGIRDYSHVFWLWRSNPAHAAASMYLATRTGKWAYNKNDTVDAVEPFSLDQTRDHAVIDSVAHQMAMASRFQLLLDQEQIGYTPLEYCDVARHVATHWPQVVSQFRSTGRSFEHLLTNSHEVEQWIRRRMSYHLK